MTPRLFVALVIAAALAIFMIQNAAVVEIRFLWWELSMSRSLFVLLILAGGFSLGWLVRSLSGSGRR